MASLTKTLNSFVCISFEPVAGEGETWENGKKEIVYSLNTVITFLHFINEIKLPTIRLNVFKLRLLA